MLLWRTSPAAGTTDRVAAQPITAPPPAAGIPAGFVPGLAGAERGHRRARGGRVRRGHRGRRDGVRPGRADRHRGVELHPRPARCARPRPASRPPTADAAGCWRSTGASTGFCSEMTALRPDTGARVAARNADVVPGTQLVADDTFVLATGERYLEVERSDLVKTLEYGAVIAPAQPDRQPRAGCAYGSTALAARRLGVLERCPDDATDRLTVLSPDPADAEKPEEEFSVLLPADRGDRGGADQRAGRRRAAQPAAAAAVRPGRRRGRPGPPRRTRGRPGHRPAGRGARADHRPRSRRPGLLVDRLPHGGPRPGRADPALDAAGHARARPALRRRPAASRCRTGCWTSTPSPAPGCAPSRCPGTTGPRRCGWPRPAEVLLEQRGAERRRAETLA